MKYNIGDKVKTRYGCGTIISINDTNALVKHNEELEFMHSGGGISTKNDSYLYLFDHIELLNPDNLEISLDL